MDVTGSSAAYVSLRRLGVIIEAHCQEWRRTHNAVARTEHGSVVVEQLSARFVARTVLVVARNHCSVDRSTAPADSPTVRQCLNVRRQTIITGRHVVSWLVVICSQQSSCLAVVPAVIMSQYMYAVS